MPPWGPAGPAGRNFAQSCPLPPRVPRVGGWRPRTHRCPRARPAAAVCITTGRSDRVPPQPEPFWVPRGFQMTANGNSKALCKARRHPAPPPSPPSLIAPRLLPDRTPRIHQLPITHPSSEKRLLTFRTLRSLREGPGASRRSPDVGTRRALTCRCADRSQAAAARGARPPPSRLCGSCPRARRFPTGRPGPPPRKGGATASTREPVFSEDSTESWEVVTGLWGGEVAGAEAHRAGTALASRAHTVGGSQPAPTELLCEHDFGAGEGRAGGFLHLLQPRPHAAPPTLFLDLHFHP